MARLFIKRFLSVLFGLIVALTANGATYNLFSPASGVLIGNPSTYVTTAATSTNILGLWSGTCNNTTYMRGDGSCQVPPGTGGGTVNSVALTAPSVFSVSGSPITNTGTLALTFATGQTANQFLATPNGSTGAVGLRSIVAADLPAIDLTSGVTGTLPFGNGGTGATSFTNHGVVVAGTSSLSTLAVLGTDTLLQGTTGADPGPVSVPNCGSSTQALAYSTSTHTFSCQTISAGTVTSVALTAPSVFSVSGSPVTSSGTLAVTFATGQTANQVLASPNGSTGAVGLRALVGADIPQINLSASGNGGVTGNLPVGNLNGGSGATAHTYWNGSGNWSAIDLTADVSGILPTANGGTSNGFFTVSGPATSAKTFTFPNASATVLTTNAAVTVGQGGTGATTLTGYVKGNGTSAFTASSTIPYSDITGTPSIPTAANPSASVGLTAVNGSANTWMRSDAAPALSQAITPTWTGLHSFSAGASFEASIQVPNNGTSGALKVGYLNSAITSTQDGFVTWVGSSQPLNTSGANGSLLLAARNTTGGDVILATGNARRMAVSDTGAVTISAPSSGTGLTVSGSSSSTPALNVSSGTIQIGGSAGTSGQVLTSQGSGAAPIWQTIPKMVGAEGSSTSTGSVTQLYSYGGATMTFSSKFNTGTISITLGGFTSEPSCTANSRRGADAPDVMEIPTLTSSNVVVVSRNTISGTLEDQQFVITCIGN